MDDEVRTRIAGKLLAAEADAALIEVGSRVVYSNALTGAEVPGILRGFRTDDSELARYTGVGLDALVEFEVGSSEHVPASEIRRA